MSQSVLPMSFFIIPAEELPMLNLPEFRMFMATCPTQTKQTNTTLDTVLECSQLHVVQFNYS